MKDEQMAFITDIRTGGTTWAARFAALRAEWAENAAKRKIYRTTVEELQSLSTRDLADLGIDRSMIFSIATEAAYGK
jgi:uncharacterized protein YjiS (DUF1127 family)